MKQITFTNKQLRQGPDGFWLLRKKFQGEEIKKKLPLDLPPRKLAKKDDPKMTPAPAKVIAAAIEVIAQVITNGKVVLEQTKLRKERVATLQEVFEIYEKAAKTKTVSATNRKAAINALCYVVATGLGWPDAKCTGSTLRAEKRKRKVGKLSTSILTEKIIKRFSEVLFQNGPKRLKFDGLKPHERGEPGMLTEKETKRVNISLCSVLTMARMVFAKRLTHSRKGIYTEIKLPDLTDFLEADEGQKTIVEPYQMPSVDELARLNRGLPELKATNPEAYKCYMCQKETGARLFEAAMMMFENFAESIQDGLTYTFTDTKSGHPRIVPFSKKLYSELLEMQTDDEYVVGVPEYYNPRRLGRNRGDSYRRHRVGKDISDWMRSCGWKRRQTNHENRKVFGTIVADETKDLRTVQYVLGHKRYETTEKHYVAHARRPQYQSPTDSMPREDSANKSRQSKAA